ncbi:FkbM family methyltransferase [Sphingomonadaceae bacterium]|nr:FkbM family methyltransferase [Sphingomonadaceae bacterium]
MAWREPMVLSELRERLKDGGRFVEVGSNIGFYTVIAGQITGSSGAVMAVGMMPQTMRILRHNIALNRLRNVKSVEAVLGGNVRAELEVSYDPQLAGQATAAQKPHGEKSVSAKKLTSNLDSHVDFDMIDLIKIDVEGAEVEVLNGAHETIKNTSAVIFSATGDINPISKFLTEKGFSVRHLENNDYIAERI